MRRFADLAYEDELGLEDGVGDLPRVDPQRVCSRGVRIASAELPRFPIDLLNAEGHLLPASFSRVCPRVVNALQTLQQPRNTQFVLYALKLLSYTPGGQEHFDPFLTIAIAARENGPVPFRPSEDPAYYHTYHSGGLDVVGSAIAGGALTEHHTPVTHLARWRAYLGRNRTAIIRGSGRPAPLLVHNEQGRPVYAAGLQNRDLLIAYGSFLIFRWDDQRTLQRNTRGEVGGLCHFAAL